MASPLIRRSVALIVMKLLPMSFAIAVALTTLSVTADSIQVQAVREERLVGDFYHGSTPARAILLLGGSEGGIAWHGHRAPINALVKKGYAVLALAYFKHAGLPETLNSIPLEYFDNAIRWLTHNDLTMGGNVAIIGGSKGAEAALLVASTNELVDVVIGFSPSAYTFQGIFHPSGEVRSSWTRAGVDVPFAPFVAGADSQPGEYVEMYRNSVADPRIREQAMIRVESITASILLVSGAQDRMWPSEQMGDAIVARLREHGFDYPFFHEVLDVGHGVSRHPDVWPKVTNFLTEHFAPDLP